MNGRAATNVATAANRLNFKRLVVVPVVKIGSLATAVDALCSGFDWLDDSLFYCRLNLVSGRSGLSGRLKGTLKAILAYAQTVIRNTALANNASAVSCRTEFIISFALCTNPTSVGVALMNRTA